MSLWRKEHSTNKNSKIKVTGWDLGKNLGVVRNFYYSSGSSKQSK